MVKLKIKQVSYGKDALDSDFLIRMGFRPTEGKDVEDAYSGAVPAPGETFFIYYDEPRSDSEKGFFRLVRIKASREIVISSGTATKSHVHEGLNTLTFYGAHKHGEGWSFHCERPS